jgi:hypothetical protein
MDNQTINAFAKRAGFVVSPSGMIGVTTRKGLHYCSLEVDSLVTLIEDQAKIDVQEDIDNYKWLIKKYASVFNDLITAEFGLNEIDVHTMIVAARLLESKSVHMVIK